jgi:hypothetical protein
MTDVNMSENSKGSAIPAVLTAVASGTYIGGLSGVGGGHAVNSFMATLNSSKAAETGFESLTNFVPGMTASVGMGIATAMVVTLQCVITNPLTEGAAESSNGAVSKDLAANIRLYTTVGVAVIAACLTTANVEGHENFFDNRDGIVSAQTLTP